MKININILIIIALCLNSCSFKNRNPELTLIPIQSFETDLNFNYLTVVPNRKEIIQTDSSIYLYFKNGKRGEIMYYRLKRDTIKYVNNLKFENPDFFFRYFILSTDSIYNFITKTSEIITKNKNDEVLNTFELSDQYVPVALPQINLVNFNNDFILGNSSHTIGVAKKKDRLIYYKEVNPILFLSIKNSNVKCKSISQFPDHYKKSGNNYYDYYPSACFGKNGNICVSFGADDYLSLYHDSTLILKKMAKSKYIDKFLPYPDEKTFDMLYLKNYLADEPKYKAIIYNSYENCYFRIVKHRNNISKENNSEIIWSIMLLDTELNVLGEQIIDPIYLPEFLITTPFGILMAKESTKTPGNTVLTLIKVKINEK